MSRLMTGREAINELNDIINDIDITSHMTMQQLNRTRFLIDYVHGKLPVDPDFEAMHRQGICY